MNKYYEAVAKIQDASLYGGRVSDIAKELNYILVYNNYMEIENKSLTLENINLKRRLDGLPPLKTVRRGRKRKK